MLSETSLDDQHHVYQNYGGPARIGTTTDSFGSDASLEALLEDPSPTQRFPAGPTTHRISAPSRGRLAQCVYWVLGVGAIVWYGVSYGGLKGDLPGLGYAAHDARAYSVWDNNSLPEEALPVIVADRRGRAKWTVSIPPELDFPLLPKQYVHICSHVVPTSTKILDLKRHRNLTHYFGGHPSYYAVDPNYMDVAEAKQHGILPSGPRCTQLAGVARSGYRSSRDVRGSHDGRRVCDRSLTYVLESSDAGFGNVLFGLWTAYGLAQKEDRAFFVDDSHWAYGEYLTYFAPPPAQSCRPPPRNEIVPCPHQARHLVASAATVHWTFGHAFNDEWEDAKAMRVMRQKPIFSLARVGYEALFHLNQLDESYVTERKEALRRDGRPATTAAEKRVSIGVHVRRGDRFPHKFRAKKQYMPLDRYVSAVESLAGSIYNSTTRLEQDDSTASARHATTTLVASDDIAVYGSEQFHDATKAQDRARPEPLRSSDSGLTDFSAQHGNRSGGFFSDAFWALDVSPSSSASAQNRTGARWGRATPSAKAVAARELLARSYLLDMKILGEATDGVVCAVSAVACRLLAVMMGWERAIERRQWMNIDRPGDWDWTGIMW